MTGIQFFFWQSIGTEPDWELAQSLMEEAGWTNVELEQVGKIGPDKLPDVRETSRKAYSAALNNGSAMIVYPDIPSETV